MKATLALLTMLLITGCSKESKLYAFPHNFYIWNQQWNAAVVTSVEKWEPMSSAFHVLAVSYKKNLEVKRINVNWQSFQSGKIKVVFRINGNTLPTIESVLSELENISNQIDDAQLQGLEIDFDSPTSQLKVYDEWLTALKGRLSIELGITAIPTWLASNHLPSILDRLDFYILQVHSVLSPEDGLFNKNLAIKWSKQFNNLSDTPFLIALPNYWYQAGLDNKGKILYLNAEQSNLYRSKNALEIVANPEHIASAIKDIEGNNLKHFTGWIWFRMPTSNDSRIFSDATIIKLIDNNQEWKKVNVDLIAEPIMNTSKNYDFWLINNSRFDVVSDGSWLMDPTCKAEHLIKGVKKVGSKLLFASKKIFKPEEKVRIGWGICNKGDKF